VQRFVLLAPSRNQNRKLERQLLESGAVGAPWSPPPRQFSNAIWTSEHMSGLLAKRKTKQRQSLGMSTIERLTDWPPATKRRIFSQGSNHHCSPNHKVGIVFGYTAPTTSLVSVVR
jgi:hypothetical protein